MKSLLVSIVLWLIPLVVLPQLSYTDSLEQKLALTTQDSARTNLLQLLAHELRRKKSDVALSYAQQALEIAQKNDWDQEIGQSYIAMGLANHYSGEYNSAIEHHQKGLTLLRNFPDSLSVANCYQNLGNTYRHLGDYATSLTYQVRAAELRKEYKAPITLLADSYINIGNVHIYTGKYEAAITQYRKAMDIWKTQNNPEKMANLHSNIGGLYIQQEDYEDAKTVLKRGLMLFDSLGLSYGIGATSVNLGNALLQLGQLDSARIFTEKGLALYQEKGDKGRICLTLFQLGDVELEMKRFSQARQHYEDALNLATQQGRKEQIKEIYLALANLHSETGEYQQAFDHHLKYTNLKDSLAGIEKDRQIQEIQTAYETEQKDQELALFREDQHRRIRENRGLITGLVLILLLLIATLLAIYSRNKAYKRLQREQMQTQSLLNEKEHLLHELEETQMHLIHAEKMAGLGQLTSGIAHEINNPINFVSSSVSALKLDLQEVGMLLEPLSRLEDEKADSAEILTQLTQLQKEIDMPLLKTEIQQLIGSIERGTQRAAQVVQNLRMFSRNIGEDFHPADLHEGLDATLTLLQGNMSPEVKVTRDYGSLPPVVCHISRINQAFLYILTNALEAIEEAGTLTIATRQVADEVEIQIKDDGKGMKPEVMKRMYEPFYTTKGVAQGKGLGLSISYGIVQQHQGRIEVESEWEVGTTVFVYLPLKPA